MEENLKYMESAVFNKICENEIISNIKHNNLTPYEMAVLIRDYLKEQKIRGVKLEEIEKKLGITKRVLYKYTSILKIPKEIYDKYKDKLSFEQMSVVTYSVKDKAKIDEVLDMAVNDNIPSSKLVYKVAELNDIL